MSDNTTREVCVLTPFDGHRKGDVITVAYQTDRQRKQVNEKIHRGFLTLEVTEAKRHLAAAEKTKEKPGG